jgi:hypothetical protein
MVKGTEEVLSKTCPKCADTKPLDSFNKGRSECKPCQKAYMAAYNKTDRAKEAKKNWLQTTKGQDFFKSYRQSDKWRESNKLSKIKGRYGLDQQEYQHMVKASGGCCSICGDKTKLVVDHCHKTLKVRGLICTHCNHGLGKFMDSPERLQKAAEYLCRT